MHHITKSGEVALCKATKGKCPFGESNHFETAQEARNAFEARQKDTFDENIRSIPHEMKLSSTTVDILDSMKEAGFTPYIVGGSVRDSLLSESVPKDIDIEVFGVESMDQLERFLRKAKYKVDAVGKSFGVFKIPLEDGEDIDISLPRRDSKRNEGHKGIAVEIDPNLSMREAAGRRDFTINSLYYSHEEKEVKDPYNGYSDFKKGQLRHINEQFSEDPLRVIRGIQFAARFKMRLHENTAELSNKLRSEYSTLSNERIQEEFEKMLSKGDFTHAAVAMKQTGWDKDFKLDHLTSQQAQTVQNSLELAQEENEDRAVYGVSQLLKTTSKENRKFIANYSLNGDKRQRKAIALATMDGPSSMSDKEIVVWARGLRKSKLTPKDYYIMTGDSKLKELALTNNTYTKAHDDLATGVMVIKYAKTRPGPWVHTMLQEAGALQDSGAIKNSTEAEAWLKKEIEARAL